MTLLNQLREFSESHDLESIGLIVNERLIRSNYRCTPGNCLTFACTGGDGVHYSILNGYQPNQSPVVMTVPMCFGKNNMVIAESLRDFLRLGCYFGYFTLEQLCYRFEPTAQNISEASLLQEKNEVLAFLRREFDLAPIKNPGDYIEAVNEKYLQELKLGNH